MHLIKGKTLSETILKSYSKLALEGIDEESRNGGTKTLYDVTLEIENPRSRHLYLKGRKNNIFQMIAETFWVMSGDDRLDPYLSFFLPRAKEYSDDGRTWYSAYGPRLYMFDQLQGVIDTFINDGKNTRRAYLSIQMPHTDAPSVIQEILDGNKPKDISCNQMMHFYVENNKFCTKTIQRSGDVIFGTGSINPFEFSFLHELMYNEVSKIYPELEFGPYRWHVTNFHMYNWSGQQAYDALAEKENKSLCLLESNKRLIGPPINRWKEFFTDLVTIYSEAIEKKGEFSEITHLNNETDTLMDRYGVPCFANQLHSYIEAVSYYVSSKLNPDVELPPIQFIDEYQEFFNSIKYSSFRKFPI